jgi:3-methyladenine DNA glycosylase AlkD
MELVKKKLKELSNQDKAIILQRFFKTGKGQYGEGDIFLGLTVPQQREVAKEASKRFSLNDIEKLLQSKIHEERLISLLILVDKFKDSPKEIFDFYLSHAKFVNNWDLVDLSAPKIVGSWLLNKKDRGILIKLAKSENLWEKRISIVSTYILIKNGEFNDCLKISKILLKDKHDLIHKAVGWMLREVGKKDQAILEEFLKNNYSDLSRTTLRYAIERFPENLRKQFLLNNYETN